MGCHAQKKELVFDGKSVVPSVKEEKSGKNYKFGDERSSHLLVISMKNEPRP